MKKILYTSLAILFCAACEKTVDIDVPADEAKIVLQSFLNPDSTFKVHLGRSGFILDNLPEHTGVAGATVSVYEDKELVGDLQYIENGWYELPGFLPEIGKTYRVEAQKEGLGKIEASESVLERVPVSDIKVDTLTIEENGYQYHEVELTFYVEDPAGQNFYIPSAYYYSKVRVMNQYDSSYETYTNRYPLRFDSSDPGVESFCMNDCFSIISDEYFEKGRYKIRMRGSLGSFSDEVTVDEEYLYINLYNVSPSYYLYFATLKKSMESGDDPFSEPTPIFSNVEGGYGILGALSAFHRKLQ